MRASATLVGIVSLIVGIALGAVSGAWVEHRRSDERTREAVAVESTRAEQSEAKLDRLQARYELSEVHLRLGQIAMEGDRQNYGKAGEQASVFFSDLAQRVERREDGATLSATFEPVLAARDEVIAGLATAQPAVVERLKSLYLGLFTAGI